MARSDEAGRKVGYVAADPEGRAASGVFRGQQGDAHADLPSGTRRGVALPADGEAEMFRMDVVCIDRRLQPLALAVQSPAAPRSVVERGSSVWKGVGGGLGSSP
jgi:hypothetical protein